MKKLLIVLAIGTFAACNSGTTETTTTDSPAVMVDSPAVVIDSPAVVVDSPAVAVDSLH